MEAVQSIGAVALLAFLAAAAWLAARGRLGLALRGGAGRGPAELIQRLPLTAQHNLHVVRVAGETLLVVTFPNGAVLDRSRSFAEFVARARAGMTEEER